MERNLAKFTENIAQQTASKPNPSLLESIIVNHKGQKVALRTIAQVSVKDANTFMVNVTDEQLTSVVDNAIRNANLGLNPQKSEYGLVVPFPKQNDAKKNQLLMAVRKSAELTRVSIRGARQVARNDLKKYAKSIKMTTDDEKKKEKEIQTATDKFVEKVDKLAHSKEKELK